MNFNRYIEQIKLKEFGEKGQKKLFQSSILVIGAGGLGCPALHYLASSGAGRIGIIDSDKVSISNLPRQTLYNSSNIGKKKVDVAKEFLMKVNEEISVESYDIYFQYTHRDLITKYDLILDCSDNFETKYLLSDLATFYNKPIIQAGIYKFDAFLHSSFHNHAPCFRCIWPESPGTCISNCSQTGVLAPMVGILGSYQSLEALRYISGIASEGRTLIFQSGVSHPLKVKKNKTCICKKINQSFLNDKYSHDQEVEDFSFDEYEFVDIRDPSELPQLSNPLINNIELNNVNEHVIKNSKRKILLICQRGMRSLELTKKLRLLGYSNVFSLRGGIERHLERLL